LWGLALGVVAYQSMVLKREVLIMYEAAAINDLRWHVG
jgi:hypothetical protein